MDILEAQNNLIKAQQEYINTIMQGETTSTPQSSISQCVPQNQIEHKYPTYNEVKIKFMEYEKKVIRSSAYNMYDYYFISSIIPEFGNVKINEITVDMIQDYINKMDTTYSIKSIKERVMLLKNVLGYAMRNNIIPQQTFKVRFPKKPKKPYRVLDDDEYRKLYDYCVNDKSEISTAILIALEIGARNGECCGIQWKDIDLEKKTISINKTVNRTYSYETHSSELIIGDTKTIKSNRTVRITNRFAEILKSKKPNGIDENYYVATNREKPTEPRNLRAGLRRKTKKLQIPDIKVHELRHTFATRAIAKGVDVKTVAEILGHEKCDITLDVYTSCTDKMMLNALELLESE